jgi:TPR repeat protein
MNRIHWLAHCAIGAAVVLSGAAGAQAPSKKKGAAPPAPVERAVLRVTCDGDSENADVTINGEMKGGCPFDAEIPVGNLQIRAVKSAGPSTEKVFETELLLASGVVKRVNIVLGEPQLNAGAKKRRDEAEEAEWQAVEAEVRSTLPELQRRAEGGDIEAMFRLGQVHEYGTAGPVDFVKALAYYDQAGKAGHAEALYSYGAFVGSGRATPMDEKKQKLITAQAAEMGSPRALGSVAMGFLRDKLRHGPEFAKSHKELSRRAAEAGDPSSLLAEMWSKPNGESPEAVARRAFAICKAQIKSGDSHAMTLLALYMRDGWELSLPKDAAQADKLERQAARYVRKAAATGDPSSLVDLGRYHETGQFGVRKDLRQAEALYRQAQRRQKRRKEK